VLAPLSFFSAFDPPVLPPYPRLARADKAIPGFGGSSGEWRVCQPQVAEPIYELRRELDCPGAPTAL